MEVVVHSKTTIRRSLVGFIPLLISAGVFYFFLGAGAIIWLLKGHMTVTQLRVIALSVPAVVVLAGGMLYIRFVINRLSRSFLSFSGEVLVVRGLTSRGFRERSYFVDRPGARRGRTSPVSHTPNRGDWSGERSQGRPISDHRHRRRVPNFRFL